LTRSRHLLSPRYGPDPRPGADAAAVVLHEDYRYVDVDVVYLIINGVSERGQGGEQDLAELGREYRGWGWHRVGGRRDCGCGVVGV
jgi:hypothetical protein